MNSEELFYTLTKGSTFVKFDRNKYQNQIQTFEKGDVSKVGEILYSSSTYNDQYNTNVSGRGKLSSFIPVQSLDFFGDGGFKNLDRISGSENQSSKIKQEDKIIDNNIIKHIHDDNDDDNNNDDDDDDIEQIDDLMATNDDDNNDDNNNDDDDDDDDNDDNDNNDENDNNDDDNDDDDNDNDSEENIEDDDNEEEMKDDNEEEDTIATKKIQRTEEEVKEIRNKHQIHVKGVDIPDPILTFEELVHDKRYHFRQYLMKNILTKSKYKEPTAVQMQAIPVLMQGREALIAAPTGSGKTAAFALPILSYLKAPAREGFRALVIAPTRVLAEQIYRDFSLFASGKDWRIRCYEKNLQKAKDKLKSKRNDILITTPKWLTILIKEGAVNLDNVQRLVLDEADRLFELGFLEQIDEIITACSNSNVVRCLFSATMPMGVEHMASTFLRDPIRVIIGVRNAGASTVKQKLLFVGSEAGKLIAIRDKFKEGIKPPALIFVQSIERARELYQELMYDGINIEYIHGKRSDAKNREIVNNFRLGKVWVLICTDVMSRGLDFKGVSCVINYDFPTSMISYIHRIGRSGRAGREGEAITYFTYEDLDMLRNIADVMKKSGCDVPDWMLKIDGLSKSEMKQREVKPTRREKISGRIPHNAQDALFDKKNKFNRFKKKRNDVKKTTPSQTKDAEAPKKHQRPKKKQKTK